MTLHICRRLQVFMPTSAGVSHGMQALTKQASATSDGETLTNRAYYTGSGKAFINESETYAPTVKVNGIVSGCAASVGAGNDNVAIAAGVVNINGVACAVTADASNAIVRPASGKYAISLISVAADGTTYTITKGTDGDALDWTAYGGAGQMPLCPANNAALCYVTSYSNVAAAVLASELFAGESANIPYTIDAVRGYIILPAALPASYTGAVSRPVFASWYSQDGDCLQPVAETEGAKLNVKVSDLNVTPASARWEKHIPGRSSWTASVSAWKTTDNYLLDLILAGGAECRAYIKVRINSSDAYYFVGEVSFTGLDLDLKFGDIKLPYALQGDGELCRVVG